GPWTCGDRHRRPGDPERAASEQGTIAAKQRRSREASKQRAPPHSIEFARAAEAATHAWPRPPGAPRVSREFGVTTLARGGVERGGEQRILGGIHGPQIDEEPPLLDAGDDGGLARAERVLERRDGLARRAQGEQARRQVAKRRGAAAHLGPTFHNLRFEERARSEKP